MTNQEIEKKFNGRFTITEIKFDKNTLRHIFQFTDNNYNHNYSIPWRYECEDYDDFKINCLLDIVKNDIVGIREEKINKILT